MKVYSIFRSGHLLVLLCLFTVEGKKSPTGKHTCRKGLLSQVTENLYTKASSLKSSVPKDLIKNTRLLKKTTKMLFMTNCNVRDQLLSFYMKNVFSHLGMESEKLFVISAFRVLQENMNACLPCAPSTRLTSAVKNIKKTFLKLGEKGVYKAINELDILLPWIQAYIQTIV
ncbi:interleukin-26 precursor [Gallus gallus]|uniref:Interleukin family protein n=1 Tax=Gallus gallus TaxID=9031 RepID=A0A8V0YK22_CHICK|nr:interleukin-26 precursor [Gallus gallus]